MKYVKKLEGDRIYLSPINPDDYEIYTKWLNDKRITQFLTIHNKLISLPGEKEFLETYCNKEFIFAIIKKENDELLGNVGFDKINYKNGTATLGIFIGEEENLSKGYGSESIKLLIKFGFEELRLHNIMLEVLSNNERAQKAYKNCGFKECGRRHDAFYRNGKYLDAIYMEIINKKIL